MGLLGLACIFSTVIVIDGPLLQRASIVQNAPILNQAVPLNVSMSPEIPRGFTGIWATKEDLHFGHYFNSQFNATMPAGDTDVPNTIFLEVQDITGIALAKLFFHEAPLSGIIKGCEQDICKAKLVAPALTATSCSTHVIPVNYSEPGGPQPHGIYTRAPSLDREMLLAAFALVLNETESIAIVTGFSTTENCVGQFEYTACTYASAIGEYDVTIDGDQTTLDDPGNPRILAVANNTVVYDVPDQITHYSTLAGIIVVAFSKWRTYVYAYTDEDGYVEPVDNDGIQPYIYEAGGQPICMSYRDMGPDILADMNKIMVYAGLVAAQLDVSFGDRLDPGLQVNTTITGQVVGTQSVYDTEYIYFFAALVVEIMCIALVAPSYWGWWTLGRPVSFSPLEVAKAFESPLLAECNSNSSGRKIAQSLGETSMRYGSKMAAGRSGATTLAFGSPEKIITPTRGTRFDI